MRNNPKSFMLLFPRCHPFPALESKFSVTELVQLKLYSKLQYLWSCHLKNRMPFAPFDLKKKELPLLLYILYFTCAEIKMPCSTFQKWLQSPSLLLNQWNFFWNFPGINYTNTCAHLFSLFLFILNCFIFVLTARILSL